MESIDGLLEAQFKHSKAERAAQYNSRVRFKCVVIDMCEAYIQRCSNSANLLHMCLPLCNAASNAANSSTTALVSEKLVALISMRC
jgi:hypothetical protein